jgi:hypothetical protein
MVIPAKVEEKIRYLIRKYPNTEWSGVLFYTYAGNFEDNDLIITCEDLYPMDLGTSGWTEFKMTPDVTAYIAENLELFQCNTGLVHSHHTLGAFFSGQDVRTLQVEGNDTNCFVSLIVDTKGTYQAAVTRKVQKKVEVVTKSLGTSYQFFGEGAVTIGEDSMSESTQIIDKEVIEYFMLNIEKEEVSNPLDYLDKRFDEIVDKKAQAKKTTYVPKKESSYWNKYADNTDFTFRDYLKNTENATSEIEEPYLFDEETMKELEEEGVILCDEKAIHDCVCKLIACSFIIDTSRFNLKQWINNYMKKKYDEIFSIPGSFDSWSELIIDYMLENYQDDTLTVEDYSNPNLQLYVAQAMYDELFEYSGYNTYIDQYLEVLSRYALEN